MSATYVEPFRAYHFNIEIEGVVAAQFTQCTGVSARVERIAYRSGNEGQSVHQLAGNVDYDPLVLRYGVTADVGLWQWMKASLDGTVVRKPISIIHLSPDGMTEQSRYNLFESWPCEWRAAPLDAMSREVAIETLTIVYEKLERA